MATAQFDLFGTAALTLPMRTAHLATHGVLHPALSRLAFCYTATAKGNNSGIRFMASLPDAQAWCSRPESSGMLHGTQWSYFYTTVAAFISCHWGPKNPRIDIAGLSDSGQWDARIAAAGVHMMKLDEFARVLTPYGVSVVGSAQVSRAAVQERAA